MALGAITVVCIAVLGACPSLPISDSTRESGIHVSIVDFNVAVNNTPFYFMDRDGLDALTSYLDGLVFEGGTALYSAAIRGGTLLSDEDFPSDLGGKYMVVFSDGIDTRSSSLGERDMILTEIEEALTGKAITTHLVGVKGENVRDEAESRETLCRLSSARSLTDCRAEDLPASGEYYVLIEDNDDALVSLRNRFEDIAEALVQETRRQSITLQAEIVTEPLVRWTFDVPASSVTAAQDIEVLNRLAQDSRSYIEGGYSRRDDGLFILANIEYSDDIEFFTTAPMSLSAEPSPRGEVFFTFRGIKGDSAVDFTGPILWVREDTEAPWVNRSKEVAHSADEVVEIDRSSIAVALVIDRSGSVSKEKLSTAVDSFLTTLHQANSTPTSTIDTDGMSLIASGTSSWLEDVAHANNSWVAVGSGGAILTASTPQGPWRATESSTSSWLEAVAHANNTWVAVGSNGTILTASTPQGPWRATESGTSSWLEDVAYANNSWVAVGVRGTILTASTPQGPWRAAESGTMQTLVDVAHTNNTWVAVGSGGIIITTSTPQGPWRATESGTSSWLVDVAHANNTWVAVGSNGTILTASTPQGPWSAAESGTSSWLEAVAHANNSWVAVGAIGAVGSEGTIRTSTTPQGTWRAAESGTSQTLEGVANANNTWVVVGSNGTILVAD